MKIKINGNLVSLVVIIAAMLLVIGTALGMQYFSSKLVPIIVGGAVLVLTAIELAKELRSRSKQAATESSDEEEEGKKTGESWRKYLVNAGWVAGFILEIILLGYLIAIPLFLISYMRWLGTRWLVAIVFAALTTALIYGIFVVALKTQLYQGLVFRWLGYW